MSDLHGVELQDITKRFGTVVAVDDMNLKIRDGEFFSLLGPSGCGKTTTLRMIAGFEEPTQGEIYLHGQPVATVPPYKRPVNTVFQSYALFPHLTVAQNVAFGLQMKKVPRPEIERRVYETLVLVRLPGMAERKPKQLSGGQQQRVALARALVNRPQVLLLDEPLGALDLKLRKAMQLELKHIQEEVGITFIYVTHDQEEALTMSDRIAVMNEGIVQQVGMPREIYEHPANRFVADFIGETNFIDGKVGALEPFVAVEAGDVSLIGTADGRSLTIGQAVTLAIRPESIDLRPEKKQSAVAERLANGGGSVTPADVEVAGQVQEVIYIGTDTRYRLSLGEGVSVVVRVQNYSSASDRQYEVGEEVFVHWSARNAQVLTE